MTIQNVVDRTIFAKGLNEDPIAKQRRCGFFVLNEVNPGVVAGSVDRVVKMGRKCRVRYREAILMPGVSPWSAHVPEAILCDHDEDEMHEAVRFKWIEASWSEVKA